MFACDRYSRVVAVWEGKTVKTRALIDGASYGAEASPAMSKAFDAAWAEIAWIFDKDPLGIEKARELLARAVLSIASEDSRSVDVLKRAALERMASDYQRMARH
jgi:hypothetical protein